MYITRGGIGVTASTVILPPSAFAPLPFMVVVLPTPLPLLPLEFILFHVTNKSGRYIDIHKVQIRSLKIDITPKPRYYLNL